ncbi:MAG: ATP-binding protein [Planctomycetota bacterium]
MVLNKNIVYPHFAYIPIVIAGLWWGMRGLPVAVALAGMLFVHHATGSGCSNIWDDAVRAVMFVAVAAVVGYLKDRSVREEAELLALERRYRMLIDKALTGIFVYRDETILLHNPKLREILGRPAQELDGMRIWELFHPDDRERVRALVEQRKQEGFADLRYECRLLKKDGGFLWADMASSLTEIGDAPTVIVNVYDITVRKKAAEEREAYLELIRRKDDMLVHSTRLAELGEMAAGVAHELNQPLTGIRNFARNAYFMIEQGAGSPAEVADNLRLISEQVDRASRIIQQMRALTRKTEQRIEPVDVNHVLGDCLEFLAPQFRMGEIAVRTELAAALPMVPADRVRIEQVFLNILMNAKQAMEGQPRRELTVRTSHQPGEDRPVAVVIADTGVGFDPGGVEKLFAPFHSTKEKGTGLGLSISLSIIKDHNGTITAEGRAGAGATFTVRLPAAPAGKENP